MFHGYLPMIVAGLGVTLSVASVSLMIACLFGLAGATAKLSHSPLLRSIANAYTTGIRSLPDLLLMLGVFTAGRSYSIICLTLKAGDMSKSTHSRPVP